MSRLASLLGAALVLAAPAWAVGFLHILRFTATYKVTLSVGPVEKMYTADEVKTKHPTSGEVMVGESMMSMDSMPMGKPNRHLEVHIASKATGKLVTNARPTITLSDMTGMATAEKVNAMAMQGIGEGVADLHYGDNVSLKAGHRYKVVVTVKGEKATFSFKA